MYDISIKYKGFDAVLSESDSILISPEGEENFWISFVLEADNDNFNLNSIKFNWQDYTIALIDFIRLTIDYGEENKKEDEVIFNHWNQLMIPYIIKEKLKAF